MATACTTDVISALIQVGDLEALQRVTPADYDWFGYLSKTQKLGESGTFFANTGLTP